MIRKVDIYIEGNVVGDYEKIELFSDEKIVINSSIQNIQDISKVFTDFSQSFTIPASPTNNRIVHYFYESDIDIDLDSTTQKPLWNPNYKRRAFIEIDKVPFRSGSIAIEKAQVVNNKIESYTIGFYGDLTSLKDTFGSLKLSDLDFSSYDIAYSYSNVKTAITDSDPTRNLRFPLISSDRVWTYGDSSSNDITTNTGSINYTELFPALKVSAIFSVIQNYFGITFTGNFISSVNTRWSNLFLWLKNSETFVNTTGAKRFDFTLAQVTKGYAGSVNTQNYVISGTTYDPYLSLVGDTIFLPKGTQSELKLMFNTSNSCTVYFEVYKNGIYQKTLETPNQTYVDVIAANTHYNYDDIYYFKVYTSVPAAGELKMYCQIYNYTTFWVQNYIVKSSSTESFTSSTNINKYMPDMTVADFFTSILKTFNLTCYGTSPNTFRLEPLDDFYSRGALIDITKLVNTDNIEVTKVPIYKTLTFEHAKSENFKNQEYYNNNKKTREYGDAKTVDANLDTGEFSVKTGFSDMLQTNLTTTLSVGYSLGKYPSYEKQIPPPLLLYYDWVKYGNFKLTNGSGTYENLGIYASLGSETYYNGQQYSLHFSDEYSVLNGTPLFNSLYATYYASWLGNLYNPKCRLTNISVNLPVSLLTNLKLQDRVIIRDKRYTINDMKLDLTSGECQLSLLNDFRPVVNTTFVLQLQSSGGTILVEVVVPEGGQVCLSSTDAGVLFNQSCFTDDGVSTITYLPNLNPITNITAENGDALISSDFINIVKEESDTVGFPITITITYSNGTTEVQTYYINYDN